MRGLVALWLLVLAPGLMWAQASPQQMDSPPNNTADDLRALREALAHAQKQEALQRRKLNR